MAVTVDATATAAVTTAGATTLTNSNLTVGAGATALLAWLSHDQIAIPVDTISAINWDDGGTPQAMTQLLDISSPNTNVRVRLYGLVNPTPGNKALKATWVNSDPAVLDCISFNGTINSTVAAAFLHAATNSALTGAPSLSVTSAVGNIVVASVAETNAVTSLTATSSTSVFNFTSATPYGFVGARAPGASSVAWTGAPASSEWCIGGVDVVAAPVAGPITSPRGGTPLATILSAWTPPDPSPFVGGRQPLARRTLPPSIEAVPVNPPPFSPDYNQQQFWTVLGTWLPPDPLPQRKLPSQTVSVDIPSFGGYLAKQPDIQPVYTAWIPPDPTPWQKPPTQIVSVDRPPVVKVWPWLSGLLASWIPPDPPPTLAGKVNPSISAVAVNNPPTVEVWPWLAATLSAWVPPDPQPTLAGKLNASVTAVAVNLPPFSPDYNQQPFSTVLSAWVPPDPAPWQRPATQIVSVDNPSVGGYQPIQAEFGAVLASWQIPDPPVLRLPKTIVSVDNPPPRMLPPILPAQVQDAMPQRGAFLPQSTIVAPTAQPALVWSWLSTVLSGWTGVEPLPSSGRLLPPSITAVPVNNPPPINLAPMVASRAAWDITQTPPQTGAHFIPPPPVVTAAQPAIPFPWLGVVLSSWTSPDPLPQQKRPAQIVSVDNPPPRFYGWAQLLPWAWVPPDPAPIQSRNRQALSVDLPPIRSNGWVQSIPWPWQPADPAPTQSNARQVSSVDRPPVLRSGWFHSVLSAWVAPDPLPQQIRPLQTTVSVSQPPPRSYGWVQSIPWTWVPPDPAPQQSRAHQFISVDRPPIRGAYWLPGILGKWKPADPQPQRGAGYSVTFPIPVVSNPPPLSRLWLPSTLQAWVPPDPAPTIRGYRTSFIIPFTDLVPRRGRFVFVQPDIRSAALSQDVRSVVLPPDIRAVVVPPDEPGSPMDPVNIPAMYWTAAGPNDTDWYFLILDAWLPAVGDTVSSPTVTITPITGDISAPTASSVSVDTGAVTLTVSPGIPYVSAGPRIKVKIVGGTIGNTYSTVVGWQDAQGRAIFRTVLLPIEAR